MAKTLLPSGIRLHSQQVGEGPDMVMVHGITGNLAVWHLHLAPALSDHFRVLTYDLRAHGYSDAPPTGYSLDAMTQDLLELLDAICDAAGRDMEPIFEPPRAGDILHSVADLSVARRELGYEVVVPLREGIARTVAWYRDGPATAEEVPARPEGGA